MARLNEKFDNQSQLDMQGDNKGSKEAFKATTALGNQNIRKYVQQECPRMKLFYNAISDLFLLKPNSIIDTQMFSQQVWEVMNIVEFQEKPSLSSVCGKQLDKGYYECYDCRRVNVSCYCQQCFQYEIHKGHMFAYIDNDTGFCDCGDANLLKKQGMCSKHQNIQKQPILQEQFDRQSKEFHFLFSLSLAIYEDEQLSVSAEQRQIHIYLLLELIKKIIDNSNYYQQIMSKVLPQKPNYLFNLKSQSFLKVLIEKKWIITKIEEKIAEILITLDKYEEVKIEALSLIFRLISNYGSQFKVKAFYLKHYVRQSISDSSFVIKLVNKQIIKDLVIKETSTIYQSARLILVFYEIVLEIYPEYFLDIAFFLIDEVPLTQWLNFFNLESSSEDEYNEIITIFYTALTQMFKHFRIQSGRQNQKKEHLQKLVKQSFKNILFLKGKSDFFLKKIFTFSLLLFLDFDLKRLKNMSQSEFEQLFMTNNLQKKEVTDSLFSIAVNFYYLFIDQSSAEKCPKKINIAKDFLCLEIICIIFQIFSESSTEKGETIVKYFANKFFHFFEFKELKKEEEDQIYVNLKMMVFFIKTVLFATESSIFETLVMNELDQQHCYPQAKELLRQLATIYKGKSKIEFKNIAEDWLGSSKMVRQFIIQQFQQYRKIEANVQNVKSNISFNSYFCLFQSFQERLLRFKAKIYSKQNQLFQNKIADEIEIYLKEFVSIFNWLIGIYEQLQEKKQYNYWIINIINDFFEMFVTIYLASASAESKMVLQENIKNQELLTILNSTNKEAIKMFEEVQSLSKAQENNPTKQKKIEQIIKKKNKLQALKQKQKKIMNEERIKNELQSKAKIEHQCIICKIAEDKEPLFYLCHIKESNVLTKRVFKSDKTFLMLTTCGHLVHESCLNQSLSKDKAYQTRYSCFLCKKLFNLLLPLKSQSITEDYVKQFWQNVSILLSLQLQRQMQNRLEIFKDIGQSFCPVSEQKEKRYPSAQELFNSLFYQIYYYLLDSQLFINYMLPILPNLMVILRQSSKNHQNKAYVFSGEKISQIKIQESIEQHLNLTIQGTWNQSNIKNSVQIKENITQDLSTYQEIDWIRQLFKGINGQNSEFTYKNKTIKRFNLFNPPKDLADFKRMVSRCMQCSRLFDKMKICLICGQVTCNNCQTQWKMHNNHEHKGVTVSLTVRSGIYSYESMNEVYNFQCIYKNYLGQEYNEETIEVKDGDYLLDQSKYQQIVQDIVMQFVEGKVTARKQQHQRVNCQTQ